MTNVKVNSHFKSVRLTHNLSTKNERTLLPNTLGTQQHITVMILLILRGACEIEIKRGRAFHLLATYSSPHQTKAQYI